MLPICGVVGHGLSVFSRNVRAPSHVRVSAETTARKHGKRRPPHGRRFSLALERLPTAPIASTARTPRSVNAATATAPAAPPAMSPPTSPALFPWACSGSWHRRASGVAGRCGPSGPSGVSDAEGASRSSSFPCGVKPRPNGRRTSFFRVHGCLLLLGHVLPRSTLRPAVGPGGRRTRSVGVARRSCNVRLESGAAQGGRGAVGRRSCR